MNQKKLAQIMVTLIAIAIGVWQYFGINHQSESSVPAAPSIPVPRQDPRDGSAQAPDQQNTRPERGERSERSAGRVGDFDYYLVSLSWSPSYCVLHPEDLRQCGKGYGFVLHGLWPQKMSGGYPEDCELLAALPESVLRKTLAFMPSDKLIHHEWKKHGSCSELSAEAYFSLADQAFAAVRVPTRFEQPQTAFTVTADEVRNDFAAANPQFPADTFTVQCSGDKLQEIRVCMSTAAKAQACGRGIRSQCRDGQIQVPASR